MVAGRNGDCLSHCSLLCNYNDSYFTKGGSNPFIASLISLCCCTVLRQYNKVMKKLFKKKIISAWLHGFVCTCRTDRRNGKLQQALHAAHNEAYSAQKHTSTNISEAWVLYTVSQNYWSDAHPCYNTAANVHGTKVRNEHLEAPASVVWDLEVFHFLAELLCCIANFSSDIIVLLLVY